MQKDFKKWTNIKESIHFKNENKLYHQREIWWCSLGLNVGYEQDGEGLEYQRPVLIVKGFSKNTCLVFPLTTSDKKHNMRIPIGLVNGKNASVIISQPKLIDTKRLVEKVGFLDKNIFENIRKAVKDYL
jgi:mRNA-degrading endonuclease toxin of MazEF toxin-antitoxin module